MPRPVISAPPQNMVWRSQDEEIDQNQAAVPFPARAPQPPLLATIDTSSSYDAANLDPGAWDAANAANRF